MTRHTRLWLTRLAFGVRHHYMLGVTAVVLALAAAGGFGYFDEPVNRDAVVQPPRPSSDQPVFVQGSPRTPVPVGPFEFNVFLVSTPEHQRALQTAEYQSRSPYFLAARASEVLLVLSAEDEVFAAHHVEEIRATFPGANVVITDLR
jgi:hypothetical protein